MERRKGIVELKTAEKRWIKSGGGTLQLTDGRVIQPNQVFEATEREISPGFRDVVTLVDSSVQEGGDGTTHHISFVLESRPDGAYNVVNQITGKSLNSAGLDKGKAEILVQELMAK